MNYRSIRKGLLLFVFALLFGIGYVFADPEFKSVSIDDEKIYVEKNTNYDIQYTILDEGATANLVWGSSNDNVATVLDGVVTGVSSGNATITAANEPEVDGAVNIATVNVKVYDSVITIGDSPTVTGGYQYNTGVIYYGHGGTITYDINLQDISETEITISPESSHISANIANNQLVITIDGEAPINDYSATITGYYKNDDGTRIKNVSESVDFSVSTFVPAFVSVSLTEDKIYVSKGAHHQLEYTILDTGASANLVWGSESESIATVADGNVYGKSSGQTSITVTNTDNVTGAVNVDSVDVVVYDSSITISEENASVTGSYEPDTSKIFAGYGGTIEYGITLSDISETNISISPEDDGITGNIANNTLSIAVDNTVTSGEYVVNVTGYYNNSNGEHIKTVNENVTVNVYDIVHVTGITSGDTYVAKGHEVVLNYTILPTNASNKGITYSLNPYSSVLEIRDDGLFAKKRGTETVTVRSAENSSFSATTNVKVVDPIINMSSKSVLGDYAFDTQHIYSGYTGAVTLETSDVNNVKLEVKKGLDTIEDGISAIYDKNVITIYFDDTLSAGTYNITVKGEYVSNGTIVGYDEKSFDIEIINNVLVESITASDMIIPVNYSGNITYTINPNTATNQNVSFIVDDDLVLNVDADGKITPIKVGNTDVTIVAMDSEKVFKTINIEVAEPSLNYSITSVVGDPDTSLTTLYTMYEATIKGSITGVLISDYEVHVLLNGQVDADAYFHLDKEVDEFTLTADKTMTVAGTYKVIVTGVDVNGEYIVCNSLVNTFVINEVLPVTGLSSRDFAVELLDEVAPSYTITPVGASNYNAVLEVVSGTDVISITDDGKVKGLKKGEARLKISSKENADFNDTVTVYVKKSEIELYDESITGSYNVDTTKIFEDYGGTFVSYYNEADVNAVEVKIINDDNDDVTADFTYLIDVLVDPVNHNNLKRLTVTVPSTIEAGTYNISLIGKYVDENSKIVSRAVDTYDLVVEENVLVETITGDDMIIPTDYDGKIKYTVSPEDVVNAGVTFSGYNTSIINVSNDGTITPIGVGETNVTIRAIDNGHAEGVVKVIVSEPSLTYQIDSIKGDYYIDDSAIYQYQSGIVMGSFNSIFTTDYTIKVYSNNTDVSSLFDIDIDEEENTFTLSVDDSMSLAQEYVVYMEGKDKDNNTVEGIGTNNSFTILDNTLVSDITADDIVILKNDSAGILYEVTPERVTNSDVEITIKDGSDVISLSEDNTVTGLKRGIGHVSIKSKDTGKFEKVIAVRVLDLNSDLNVSSIVGNYDLNTSKLYEHNTGVIKGSINCTDVNNLALKVYGGEDVDETNFDIEVTEVDGNYEFEITVKNTAPAGNYSIDYNGNYLYNNTEFGSVGGFVSFEIEENILIDTITAYDLYLSVGSSKQLALNDNYLISPSNVTSSKVDFVIPEEYEGVLSIDEDGNVEGLSLGTAVIEIYAHDSNIKKAEVTVVVSDVDVDLDYDILGNEDDYLDTDTLYAGVGGKLLLNTTISDDSYELSYEIYDMSNANKVTDLFGHRTATVEGVEYDAIIVPSTIPVGTYKLVAIASNGEDDVVDYKFFTVNENVLVGSITASDMIIALGSEEKVEYTIVSSVLGKDVTNNSVDIVLANDGKLSYDGTTNKIKGLLVGETTLTINAKDASRISKEITVNVIETSIEAEIGAIAGDYSYDTSKIYTGHGGILGGMYTAIDYNALSLTIIKDGVAMSDTLYNIRYMENGAFSVAIGDDLAAGDYQIKIVASYIDGKTIDSDEVLLDFTVYNDVKVTGIEANDVYMNLEDDKHIEFTVSPSNAVNKNVSFIDYDDTIISVDSDGNITPKKTGSSNLTIKALDGSNITKDITVNVISVDINVSNIAYLDSNGNSLQYIVSGTSGYVNGTITASGYNSTVKVDVYKNEDELVTTSFENIVVGTNNFSIPVSSSLAAGNYRVVLSVSYDYQNTKIAEDSTYFDFTVLDSSMNTSLTLLDVSLEDSNGDDLEYFTYGQTGKLNVSYRTINGPSLELTIYKDNVDITSSFENVKVGSKAFSVDMSNNTQPGNYEAVLVAKLIVEGNVISSKKIIVPFYVDTGQEVNEIIADDLNLTLGTDGRITFEPYNLSVYYIVNDNSVVEVDSFGFVKPLKVGTTSVTIKSVANSNVSKIIQVNVTTGELKNTGYTINDGFVADIGASTSLETFVANITRENSVQVKVYDNTSNKNLKTTGMIATGDTIEIISGSVTKTYEAVVPGDPSGDGKISALDYIAIRNHIMGNNVITKGAFVKAADYSNDNKVSALDYIAIRNYIMKGAN